MEHITRRDNAHFVEVIFLLGGHTGHGEYALFRDMMDGVAICFCRALKRRLTVHIQRFFRLIALTQSHELFQIGFDIDRFLLDEISNSLHLEVSIDVKVITSDVVTVRMHKKDVTDRKPESLQSLAYNMVLEGDILQLAQLYAGRALDLDEVGCFPLDTDDIRRARKPVGEECRLADDLVAGVNEPGGLLCHLPRPIERYGNGSGKIRSGQLADLVAFGRTDILFFFENIAFVCCQP